MDEELRELTSVLPSEYVKPDKLSTFVSDLGYSLGFNGDGDFECDIGVITPVEVY